MGTEFSRLTQENSRSIKCFLAVNRHLQQALLDVVHDAQYDGIPRDPEELYKYFNRPENIQKIKKLNKNVLKDDQISLLLPQNQRTFSNKWDITLICVVIINFTTVPPPVKGWRVKPDQTDTSTGAFVWTARGLRNVSNHATLETFLEEVDFKAFFTDIRLIIVGLKYKDIAKFDQLADNSIHQTIFKDDVDLFMNNIKSIKEKEIIECEILDWLKKDYEKGNKLKIISLI